MGDHQLEAFVRFLRGSKTGILPGRPLPASIAQGMNPPGKRIFSGEGEILLRVEANLLQIFLGVERFDVDSGLENDIDHFILFVFDIPRDTHDDSFNGNQMLN